MSFYSLAKQALHRECRRLCDFTDALDKDPTEKKERIAEYKCAKYRYASVSLIDSIVYNNHMRAKEFDLKYSHHLLLPFDEIFKKCAEHLVLYEAAPTEEQPEYSLYYGISAFAEQEIAKLKVKLSCADDWERIELDERIGGLRLAKDCLDEAWQRRKDGTE